MPPEPGCPGPVPLLPKLRGQFAEFLQHRSLKRLGMLYQSTCVGLGYGLKGGAISWKSQAAHTNPITVYGFRPSSRPARLRNVNLIPIAYAFRPRLRGRLTLRRLALRRNPWTFGESVSHTLCRYSCQHSHFLYLQRLSRVRLHRLKERSATRPGISYQVSGIRYQGSEA